MSVIEKFFGRKRPTTHDIQKKLAEAAAERARLIQREGEIAEARKVAVASLDEAALEAADRDLATVRRKIELQDSAIAQLQAAHSERAEVEAQESFRAEVAQAERESAALLDRLTKDYPRAAAEIASIVEDLAAFMHRRDELHDRGKRIGERVAIPHPEAFRAAPKSWSVSYPNPNGNGVIRCNAEAAPRGLIRWQNGEPVAARDGVEVIARPSPVIESLVHSVGTLPGLRFSDPYFRAAGAEHNRGSGRADARSMAAAETIARESDRLEARREIVSTFPINLVAALPK